MGGRVAPENLRRFLRSPSQDPGKVVAESVRTKQNAVALKIKPDMVRDYPVRMTVKG